MKFPLALIISISILVLGITASLSLGHYPISLLEFIQAIGSRLGLIESFNPIIESVVFDIRLPRLIAGILVGAALAVSGAAFQAIFVNPLVSPGLLGVLSGAGFGAAFGMVVSDNWAFVQGSTLFFSLTAVAFTIFLAYTHKKGTSNILMLVIGGIISSSLFSSLLSITKYVADPYDELPAIVYWLMGSLSLADAQVYYLAIPILGGVILLSMMGRLIDIASLGDDEARALGVNIVKVRVTIILIATIISSLTVVIGGLIGWIGLVIPHIIRFIVGPENRKLIPISAIFGAGFLVFADLLSRHALEVEVPVGIITSLVGVPVFILVLRKAKGAW